MALIRITVIVLLCGFAIHNCEICSGTGGKMCCTGFVWNPSLELCQPCDEGFHGPNCSLTCLYPSYGKECQLECLCVEPLCSHVEGCMTSTEETSTRKGSSQSIAPGNSSVAKSSTTRQYNCTTIKRASGVYQSVICLTAISGVLLLL
ncbi:uncharacterized protein LOC144619698 isoform X2 [Crassostrea virginica]